MTNNQNSKLDYLSWVIQKSLDGTLNDEEIVLLRQNLLSDAQLRRYYIDCMMVHGSLFLISDEISAETIEQGAAAINKDLLDLAEYEKTAPGARFLPETAPKELIQKVVYPPREKRKISRFSIFFLVMNAAAVLFLVLFLKYAPSRGGMEAATLTDSLNAEWAEAQSPMRPGTRLNTSNTPLILERGVVQLRYDTNARVVIEGPAEFRILADDRIGLTYGKMYGTVPNEAVGFSVYTPYAKIIDMGTEFGVQAETNGSAELHVIKGKVQLFAGVNQASQSSRMLTERQAVRYDAETGRTETVAVRTEDFVRSINSASNVAWRGQKHLDLADIVGGGNGTGTGLPNRAILWNGQELVQADRLTPAASAAQSFVPVRFNPFIDGIFVPASRTQAVSLASTPAELNLDDFIKQDTNGLITLMVLRQSSDSASIYWFCSKEGAAGDRAKMPSLSFPNNGQPIVLTTADGRGADTSVVNDVRNQSDRRFGASSFLPCRYIKDERLRIVYLRFDISRLQGDLSGAVLSLCLDSGNRRRTLEVYGLADGPADFWDEEILDYTAAPGLKPAPWGNYDIDEDQCVHLGSFRVIDNRGTAQPISVCSDSSLKWNAPESITGQTAYAVAAADGLQSPSGGRITLQLGNQRCSRDNPAILMHANAGLTFDLEALRKAYGPLKSFRAFCGLSVLPETVSDSPTASFYVLLDGKEVFSSADISPEDDPKGIDVDLRGTCRFLTLIAAQGSDGSIDNDFCLFLNPIINLE